LRLDRRDDLRSVSYRGDIPQGTWPGLTASACTSSAA